MNVKKKKNQYRNPDDRKKIMRERDECGSVWVWVDEWLSVWERKWEESGEGKYSQLWNIHKEEEMLVVLHDMQIGTKRGKKKEKRNGEVKE